jgi:hypothetical protein
VGGVNLSVYLLGASYITINHGSVHGTFFSWSSRYVHMYTNYTWFVLVDMAMHSTQDLCEREVFVKWHQHINSRF